MLVRALVSCVVILVFTVTTNIMIHGQNRIQDSFAGVNGVRLHYLIAGRQVDGSSG